MEKEKCTCPYFNSREDDETGTAEPICMCPDGCCGYPWYCPIRDKED